MHGGVTTGDNNVLSISKRKMWHEWANISISKAMVLRASGEPYLEV